MLQKLGWSQLLRISGEWTWNIKQILNIDFSIFDSVFEGKKKIWQVGIPMTSFQEGWSSSWSPFASWPWRIESWSLNFQGWNANRYTIISYWFSFICRKVITDAYSNMSWKTDCIFFRRTFCNFFIIQDGITVLIKPWRFLRI